MADRRYVREELENFPRTGRFLMDRARDTFTADEKRRLEGLISRTETVPDGSRVIARGHECNESTLLIDGFALRTLEDDDRRYAVSFHVPGDFVDLHCFALQRLDHNIDCVGETTLGYVPHDRIEQVVQEDPHLARLFWFSTLLDGAMHREWVMKLEQLTAPRRIAHIFSEVWHRLEMVGLAYHDGFETPLNQSDIGDMCGSTTIHANRAIGRLRREGIADFQRGRVSVQDRERLHAFGRFDPAYLYGDGVLHMRAKKVGRP